MARHGLPKKPCRKQRILKPMAVGAMAVGILMMQKRAKVREAAADLGTSLRELKKRGATPYPRLN